MPTMTHEAPKVKASRKPKPFACRPTPATVGPPAEAAQARRDRAAATSFGITLLAPEPKAEPAACCPVDDPRPCADCAAAPDVAGAAPACPTCKGRGVVRIAAEAGPN